MIKLISFILSPNPFPFRIEHIWQIDVICKDLQYETCINFIINIKSCKIYQTILWIDKKKKRSYEINDITSWKKSVIAPKLRENEIFHNIG